MPQQNSLPALLCFGDSITANGRWLTAPETTSSWRLINAGRCGRKTSDIPIELPTALTANPEATGLLLILGINDLPARNLRSGEAKIADCIAHLQNALDLAIERFPLSSIFLAAPCAVDAEGLDAINLEKGYDITPPLLASLAIAIEQLAARNGVQFLNLHETLHRGHYTDGLHPNAEGDAAIARAVRHAINRHAFYLIGDSISIDYHEALERECRGHYRYSRKGGIELARADLDHPQGANGGDSSAVLEHLRAELKKPEHLPPTLIVNCGLHDIKTDPETGATQVPLEHYRRNLKAIVDLVHSTNRRFIWITTTPVDEARHNSLSAFHRHEQKLLDYNAAALQIMTAKHVPIIDLYTFTVALDEPLFRDHVHFLPEISLKQAAFLRSALNSLLCKSGA